MSSLHSQMSAFLIMHDSKPSKFLLLLVEKEKLCVCLCVQNRKVETEEPVEVKLHATDIIKDSREEEEVKGEWKDLTPSKCLLIKSSLFNCVLCQRHGDFNLLKLILSFSTREWNKCKKPAYILMEDQRRNVTQGLLDDCLSLSKSDSIAYHQEAGDDMWSMLWLQPRTAGSQQIYLMYYLLFLHISVALSLEPLSAAPERKQRHIWKRQDQPGHRHMCSGSIHFPRFRKSTRAADTFKLS